MVLDVSGSVKSGCNCSCCGVGCTSVRGVVVGHVRVRKWYK